MTSLEVFQKRYGIAWAELTGTPAFAAALALANSEKLQRIRILTDEDIALKAPVILGDLRGFLQYESGLLDLHEKKQYVFQDIGPETYPSPIDEAREELEAAGRPAEPDSDVPVFQPPVPPRPKKKRGRPRKRKKRS